MKKLLLLKLACLLIIVLPSEAALPGLVDYSGGICEIHRDGKFGFIDKKGELIGEIEWDLTGASLAIVDWNFRYKGEYCVNDRCAVLKEGKWGFINSKGKLTIPNTWDDFLPFREGLAAVKKETKWGFINPEGKIVIPLVWDEVRAFGKNKIAWAFKYKDKSSKLGYAVIIDNSGKVVYQSPGEVSSLFEARSQLWNKENSLLKAKKTIPQYEIKRIGRDIYYVSEDGKRIGEDSWTLIKGYRSRLNQESLAVVKTGNGKCGYIDRTGKLTLPAKWETAGSFYGGIAVVRENGKHGLINRKGEYVVQPTWKYMKDEITGGMVNVANDSYKKFGYLDVTKEKLAFSLKSRSFYNDIWTGNSKPANYGYKLPHRIRNKKGKTLYAIVGQISETHVSLTIGEKKFDYPVDQLIERDLSKFKRSRSRGRRR